MTQGSQQQRVRLARALFPHIAAELDAALARNGGNAASEFDDWLDETAAAMLSDAGFDAVADSAVAARFERAFAAARTAAAGLGTTVPEPEAFTETGADFERFEAAMTADPGLLPVPAPHGLGAEAWRQAFSVAGIGIVIASEAVREFSALDSTSGAASALEAAGAAEGSARNGAQGAGQDDQAPPHVDQAGGVRWTLRLIPSGQKPATLGLGFVHGPHPTLPEMLMLQLMRAASGETPVDAASFTWLAGSLADGRLAARHVYDASEHTVRITCREIGSQGPHLGARPPVS